MCFVPPCHDYALNGHFVYWAIPRTHPLLMRKQNLIVLMICNTKVKFTFVQISMKLVLYFNMNDYQNLSIDRKISPYM